MTFEEVCIPHALLHSNRMISDKASQKSLVASAKKLCDGKLLQIAKEQLEVLKHAEKEIEALSQLAGKSVLVCWRRNGRVTLAINWAIEEIASFVSQTAGDLVSQADKVGSKLRLKGFKPSTGPHGEIPSYIWSCLTQMRTNAAKVKAASGTSAG